MTQRIHNLSKWHWLPEGHSAVYGNSRPRVIVMEVNCPQETAFFVVQSEDTLERDEERQTDISAGRAVPMIPQPSDDWPGVFVAVVKGRERLEFGVDGAFELIAVGGPVSVYTVDSQDWSTKVLDPVIFTRIANRRQRNPHLELVEYQMRLNQERFKRDMFIENERRIAESEQRMAAKYAPQRDQRAPLARAAAKAGMPTPVGRETDDTVDVDEDGVDQAELSDERVPSGKRRKVKAPPIGSGDD